MNSVLVLATTITPVVLALVELWKITLNIKKKRLPLLSVFIGGIVGGVAYPFTDLELVLRLWAGVLSGLAAVGLFELGKYQLKGEDRS
ncbi:holin [Evansella halocellulosilytica]|uniref:holin n=1 Tax=Evansella halocellulosilytica TaxID=2011013 RepID=UPI000BB7A890|nr:holin [Evansella halocellulosilytica]